MTVQERIQTIAKQRVILTCNLAKIDEIFQQMQEDRKEIEQLRADSVVIEEETKSILNQLKAMV